MATFEVTLAARVPQTVGFPLFEEVDRLVANTIKYSDELNRPGSATLGCPIRSLSSAAKERLSDLAAFPSEVWIYYDSMLVWAGEIQTAGVRDQIVELGCAGLLGYTARMGVVSELVFTDDDQFVIARALIDQWQDLPYGNYGIDTSSVATSGVLRDRTYLRDDLDGVPKRLAELSAVIDGFDFHVDAVSRELVLSYPQRGIDLSASVFLDKRNIDSAAVALSVAPEDLVSDGSFVGTDQGTDGENTSVYVERENEDLRESYGRSWGSQSFDGVSVESTLEGHGDAFLAARNGVFFQPGVTIVPRPGTRPGDFGPGDLVSYSYDAGLGLQSGVFRVAKVGVSVSDSGEQRISVEFV